MWGVYKVEENNKQLLVMQNQESLISRMHKPEYSKELINFRVPGKQWSSTQLNMRGRVGERERGRVGEWERGRERGSGSEKL